MTDEPQTRAEARARRAALSLFILTRAFWEYAIERAIKTALQTFAAVAFVGGVAISLHEIPWLLALSAAGGAALLSLITSAINYARPPAASGDDEDAPGE